ncbi:unnamed protein product [Rotaria magnacalcarata]|uniref:EGF-like domain-containing protein n=2 Tax=Rotaria magnacalcarata TaxID=392030 RepID=A0A816QHH3_9BILA|nr:unnamed protein product [Rotaria magnacalcarata]
MNGLFFCRCDQVYFGTFCNLTRQCQCSTDLFCLSPSICVCPLNKFGPRCYLQRSTCQSTNNPCHHNGFCIPIDDRINSHRFICIRKEGYRGERCQNISKALNKYNPHQRKIILKKIASGYNTMTIDVQEPFNILFTQIPDGDYYLTVLRERFSPSEYIQTQVSPKHRCHPVLDLFNETFRLYEYPRLVKYYSLLCRQDSQLICFYDENCMCMCDSNCFSNCFQFNNTMQYDCSGKNLCYNDGRCFFNNETGPNTFLCVCSDCY